METDSSHVARIILKCKLYVLEVGYNLSIVTQLIVTKVTINNDLQ